MYIHSEEDAPGIRTIAPYEGRQMVVRLGEAACLRKVPNLAAMQDARKSRRVKSLFHLRSDVCSVEEHRVEKHVQGRYAAPVRLDRRYWRLNKRFRG